MDQRSVVSIFKPKVLLDVILSLLIFGAGLIGAQELKGISAFILYSVVLFIVILLSDYHLLKKSTGDFNSLVLTGLFLIGYFGTLATVPSGLVRFVIALGSGIIIFHYRRVGMHSFSKNSFEILNIVTSIFLLVFIWALNFFFSMSWWLVIVLTFIAFVLLFRQAFNKIKVEQNKVELASVLSAVIVAQSAWATAYLPVNFVTSAVVVFVPFYLIFMLSSAYTRHRLTRDKIYFHVGVMVVVLFLSLISSPWTL